MDTKLRGDIAESAAVLHALKRGWGVLKPFGDRLPYDLAFDVEGILNKNPSQIRLVRWAFWQLRCR
ncbi:hypothetical protein VF14_05870 [Nostoc linckia z18]|uniref:PD(D/E)XK endonuclease domain-containing protein n=2 Tax=Nostoc linckia TaxID=92942 RepID=A0A9Q6EM23_NOSLI|nr:group I intron-associated PD-(D/E)XK endonuclease [Nostoc linckia]PHK33692.1 hypothetical protein VF12_24965 [Nostoc linckia z15]PHK47763.1 hypothetical protein VF13_03730 [Nostoc linckia z16]PHJ65981.1 hypothetical protein VF02_09075 [Nostoc linckia z1]PHJ68887.1 hypothetical protein VF05_14710 [Nostoc linckia z3]PHJ74538.1 hypothetical protein VF03_13535 [Nostoc linckia z2]